MNIRRADTDDLEILLEMGKQLHLVEKEFEPLLIFSIDQAKERYIKELFNSNALMLIAEENDRSIGCLYAHADKIEYLDTDQLECEIEVIFVRPEFRRQGVAQRMITECIKWAKSRNVFRIKTGIYSGNSSSKSIFSKVGFVPYHVTYTL